MAVQQKANSGSLSHPLKFLLFLLAGIFAVALIILIISGSTAATVTGQSPDLAIALVDELNTGVLAPGEERWFRYQPNPNQSGQAEQAFTLFFTPGSGANGNRVSLQLYDQQSMTDPNQRAVNFGAGRLVSRDHNPDSGELLWTGWLFNEQSYYVQLINSNEQAVDYWLVTDDADSITSEAPASVVVAVEDSSPNVSLTKGGSNPQRSTPLQARNQGRLMPGESAWYSVSVSDGDSNFFKEVALTMFVTPNEAHQIGSVSFEVIAPEEAQQWQPNFTQINNIGGGSIVRRDDDPLTGERFWAGWLVDNNLYYVLVRNGSNSAIDYWLFNSDVYYPELGE